MTYVKICGIANLDDARCAAEAGADLLGFVFHPRSARYVSPELAADIVRTIRCEFSAQAPRFVGVFVDEAVEQVFETMGRAGLHLAQLHGHESAAEVHALWPNAFKAIRPQSIEQAQAALQEYQGALVEEDVPGLLVDGYHPAQPGGAGTSADLDAARWLASRTRLLLAGGLTPENVAWAVEQVRPWGVDVSSGVELTKGHKDHARVRAFVEAVRASTRADRACQSESVWDCRQSDGWKEHEDTGTVIVTGNGPYYGPYGGAFVPETLVPAVRELEAAYDKATADPAFREELKRLLHTYAGRPTPLTLACRLSAALGGARIYLKREDLAHTGAHKINNALGQALLAQRMGKRRIVAETGAGQHGVATATVCALLGLECVVYMGTTDMARQELNVFRMRLLGAEVRAVSSGSCTLKDAINDAIRDWVTNVHTTHYLLGSALGPHPYPRIVRNLQRVIGDETREQILAAEGRLPDMLVACVGGGSNAIGLFYPFLADETVALVGVEAGGKGIESGQHAARFADIRAGRLGVLHGAKTYVLQDAQGQIAPTYSISAGLDYAAVGPEHAWMRDRRRAEYTVATDDEALQALRRLSELEGIIPALESAHAVAEAMRRAPRMHQDQLMVVNISGRGDKDMPMVAAKMGFELFGSVEPT